jgi:hypothetical protein
MIEIHQFAPGWGLNASPFFNIVRVPLETPLKHAALEHASIPAYFKRMDDVLLRMKDCPNGG